MTILLRILTACLFILTSVALVRTAPRLRGDLIIYKLPAADHTTTFAQAMLLESEMRKGIALNPISWPGRVQNAAYLAVQEKYEPALAELREAARYYKSMSAMALEATIYAEMRRYAEATAAFERLYRLSIVDRTVIQHLMRLYSEHPASGKPGAELGRLAIETDIRWPGSFDALVALANGYIADPESNGYLPLILKLFVRATLAPQEGFGRPDPHVYELSDAIDRVKRASVLVGYSSDWATVE